MPAPLFTVLIPTRNRPALFAAALRSVLAQDFGEFEVVVVNDGSDDEHADAYRALEAEAGGRVRWERLVRRPRGHGQSYALNFGAAQARGEYVCFLDDDDEWTDPAHLGRAARCIAAGGPTPDLYLANQQAYLNGALQDRTIWIEDLAARLPPTLQPDAAGAYPVTPAQLLACHGFCHLNTSIVRRTLFDRIGGFDESSRYECDRDFYLRAIDQAGTIRFSPAVVARHNIPDPARKASMSTSLSPAEKLLFQASVLDRAVTSASRPEIREYARQHKVFVLKRLAQECARTRSYRSAWFYAREALLPGFNAKWLSYCVWLGLRSLTTSEPRLPP